MNFIRNRNFRAGPKTSLEGFICPQNSDKQQKIKVFGRSGGQILSFYIVGQNLLKRLFGLELGPICGEENIFSPSIFL